MYCVFPKYQRRIVYFCVLIERFFKIMEYKITSPRHISAVINLPSSKSISNRVLVINALSGNVCGISNVADCDDTAVMLKSLSEGAERGRTVTTDVHGAGTSMRFLTAYYSLVEGTRIMTGSQRMLSRPINVLVDALRQLGAKIDYLGREGYPPLRITGGGMKGGSVELPAGVSSQYVSALLMIAPKLPGGLKLTLTGEIASRPYIDMTLALMNRFGAAASWTAPDVITVDEGEYKPCAFTVENDWSAASYWYEMVMLSKDNNAKVMLKGLCKDSLQGDRKVAEYFDMLGVSTGYAGNGVELRKKPGSVPEEVVLDLHGEPDLAQTLVVACTMAGIRFRFSGLANLKIKETDRLAALTDELAKLGYVMESDGNGSISWSGERCGAERNPAICTYDDHRMAMSFAPVCLCRESVVIKDPEVVTKSYPRYWEDLAAAGFGIEKR